MAGAPFFVGLLVLLAASVLAGELSLRFGQVTMVGQVLVGVLVGPYTVGAIDSTFHVGLVPVDPTAAWVTPVSQIALFFILFLAGLELTPEDIRSAGRAALLLGSAGFVVPFLALSAAVGLIYPNLPTVIRLFVATVLSVEALPVVAIILAELGLLKSRIGRWVIASSIVALFLTMSVFGILSGVYTDAASAVAVPLATIVEIAIVQLALFLSIILTIHFVLQLIPPVLARATRLLSAWRTREASFAFLMILALAAGLLSTDLGLTFLPGVFFAGLLLSSGRAGPRFHADVQRILNAVCWGFFIPLYFALVGVNLDLPGLVANAGPLLALFGIAVVAKLGITVPVARRLGANRTDALTIGFLANSRGAVELALASILLASGIIDRSLFSVIALVGILTTLLAPIGASLVRRGSVLPALRASVEDWKYPGTGGIDPSPPPSG
jgi:Kef-type K+ transport system membrane component KefB